MEKGVFCVKCLAAESANLLMEINVPFCFC